MKKRAVSGRSNLRVARNLWGELSRFTEGSLRELTVKFSLSVAAGDLQLLNAAGMSHTPDFCSSPPAEDVVAYGRAS